MVKVLMFLINIVFFYACTKVVTSKEVFVKNEIFYYKKDSSIFSGVIKDNFHNRLPKRVRSVKNGKLNGYTLSFYKNGRISFIAKYSDNKRIGGFIFYYPDGKIKEKLVTTSQNKSLLYKYNEDGTIHAIYSLKDDIFDGKAYIYYNNNKISSFLNFSKGKKHGKFTFYHTNGNKSMEGNFFNDSLDGKILLWDSSGYLAAEQYYNKGTRIGIWKYYNSKGKIQTIITFKENGKVSEKIDYSEDGKVINKIKFE